MAKKKVRVKSEEALKKEEAKYRESQLKWIIIGMVILIILVIGVYFFMQSLKKFEFGGLQFQKIMYDKLPLFYSRIPVTTVAGEVVAYYNMYLRNDPRKLTDIPIEGTIRLMKTSVLAVNPSIEGCEDNGIAGANLGMFFKAAGINLIHGSDDKDYADENNLTYVSCQNITKNSIIIIRQGDSNKIIELSPDCYAIQFKDCEIEKSVERFIVAVSAQAKGYDI